MNKIQPNKKHISICLTAVVLCVIGSFYFYEIRRAEKLGKKTEILSRGYWEALEQMKKAYKERSKYLDSLLQKKEILSPNFKRLQDALVKLDNLELKTQNDFLSFDRFASEVNELIVQEVLVSRKNKFVNNSLNKKSVSLFSSEREIRMLERYDLPIDLWRKQLAGMAWESNLNVFEEKKLLFARASLNSLPYFLADRMVLRLSL